MSQVVIPDIEHQPGNYPQQEGSRASFVRKPSQMNTVSTIRRAAANPNDPAAPTLLAQMFAPPDKAQFPSLTLADGSTYKGEHKDNIPQGRGTLIYSDSELFRQSYEGDFANGLPNGQGTLITRNGNKLQGIWKDGKLQGFGVCIFASGNKYEGNFKDINFHGKGKYEWKDGQVYIGNFENGMKNGQGILTKDDTKYVGIFKNDQFWEGGFYPHTKEHPDYSIQYAEGHPVESHCCVIL